jgi:hypothetical protein
MHVEVEWVDQIPRAPSGKMRVIVNSLVESGES